MLVCPHCQTTIEVPCQLVGCGMTNSEGEHGLASYQCPACKGVTVELVIGRQLHKMGMMRRPSEAFAEVVKTVRIYPKRSSRSPPPPEVPATYAADYAEAALILEDSPKASAALSRRCLQHVLQQELKIKKRNLADEIEEAITSQGLPSHVADGLDAVRKIGNFAAHPKKSEASGEIIEVEPGEAEWSLDVLEALFDHVFVGPAKLRARRAALDAKLQP